MTLFRSALSLLAVDASEQGQHRIGARFFVIPAITSALSTATRGVGNATLAAARILLA